MIWQKFFKNKSGNVALFVALLTPVMLAGGGAALETVELYRAKAVLQSATDAAALAAAKTITLTGNQANSVAQGTRVFNSNLANFATASPTIIFDFGNNDCTTDGVTARTSLTHQLFLGGIWQLLGSSNGQSIIRVQSVVNCGGDTLEVAFVIDNSGSMSFGGRLQTAQTATNILIDTAFNSFGNASGQQALKFALVPFSSLVNVGNRYRNASWADRFGRSPIHHEHFDWTTIGGNFSGGIWRDGLGFPLTRFRLYNAMRVRWQGCFESRPFPHHNLDTPPRQSEPETLFVPSFYPDPPDFRFDEVNYFNNYILDIHNIMPRGTSIEDTGFFGSPLLQHRRQSWMWKYLRNPRLYDVDGFSGGSAVVNYINTDGGPNAFCSTAELTPLTNSQNRIKRAVADMIARGTTNIHQGVIWGWRVLSSNLPFDEGRNENIADNRKIMIVMSDGENSISAMQTDNMLNPAEYSAFGFNGGQTLNNVLEKRLFANVPNGSNLADTSENNAMALNYHLAQTCENAKNAGIEIYTVTFRIANSQEGVKDNLRDCASTDSNGNALYFDAANNQALIDIFEEIAERLIVLTISG